MSLSDLAREGSYIEVEHGEARYYCRSPLDGVRTLLAIEGQHNESVVMYDGVHDEREEINGEAEQLMMDVLSDPLTQSIMSILGARLVSVIPDNGKGPKT